MTIREFLSGRLASIVVQSGFAAAVSAFLWKTGTAPGTALCCLLAVWLLLIAGVQAWEFFRCRAYLREAERILSGQEDLPARWGSACERRLLELCQGTVSDSRGALRAYHSYIEHWLREIELAIADTMRSSRKAEPEIRHRLLEELAHMEALAEQASFYARAEGLENDFQIRRVTLSDIAAQAIERWQTLLIQNGARVDDKALGQAVCTDAPCAAFILGQLLQNAVRYRGKKPVITLSAQQDGGQVRLTVRDNGAGIPKGELEHIFDRGFRSEGKPGGMGMYLCRRLAERLQIGIELTSAEGNGTSVVLTFPAAEG